MHLGSVSSSSFSPHTFHGSHTRSKPRGDHQSKTSPRTCLSDDDNSLTSLPPFKPPDEASAPLPSSRCPCQSATCSPFRGSAVFSTAGFSFLDCFSSYVQNTGLSYCLCGASFLDCLAGSLSLIDTFSSLSPLSHEVLYLATWLNTIYVFNVCSCILSLSNSLWPHGL